MCVRFLSILLLSSICLRAQDHLGFGLNAGLGGILTNEISSESPKKSFTHRPNVLAGQSRVDFFYLTGKNVFELGLEMNNYFISARDKSKNQVFFPELSDGRGAAINNGGRAKSITLSYGRVVEDENWRFSFVVSSFVSRFEPDYENYGGIILGDQDSNLNYLWQWRFVEWGEPIYSNGLLAFGIGFTPKISYKLSSKLLINFQFSANLGFRTIVEKEYQTMFISAIEPEKNAIYYNSISVNGSSVKALLGISYEFELNKKANHN